MLYSQGNGPSVEEYRFCRLLQFLYLEWLLPVNIDVFVNSLLLVFLAEMGDKTQLLALVLVVRFKKPWTILLGIFIATLLNHALSAVAGAWVSANLNPEYVRWGLVISFLAFALWILVPDKEEELKSKSSLGAFMTTLIAFFLAEMGDKTQLATIALGARYATEVVLVTLGTTLGMLASNSLAIFLGQALLAKIPMQWIRIFASGVFLVFGILIALFPST